MGIAKRVTFVCALAVVTAGCENLQSVAKKIEKNFGVPVELKVKGEDSCLLAQLKGFHREYRALPAPQREQFRKTLQQRFQRIVLNPTARVQRIRGSAEVLLMVVPTGYTPGNERTSIQPLVLATKTLLDHRIFEGPNPATKLEKNDRLAITAESAWDESLVSEYVTLHWDYYNAVKSSVNDEAFVRLLQERKIWFAEQLVDPAEVCGAPAPLHDLTGSTP
jgi:hypothetical protein